MFFGLSKILWFIATPSNLLVFVILVGTGAAATNRRRLAGLGRRAALGAAVALVAAGLLPIGTWLLAPLENRFVPPGRDDTRPVAGAIVLGGAVHPNLSFARDQIVTGDAAERVIAMADLARRHPGARIVFSGGSGALLGGDRPEAEAVLGYARTLGLDPGRILVEGRSRNTAENATETRARITPAPGERWLLVTSAWHMPRAIGVFRTAGFDVEAYPVDYRTGSPDGAWRPEPAIGSGLDRVDLAVREWLGLVAYWLSGRTGSVFPSPSPEGGPIR